MSFNEMKTGHAASDNPATDAVGEVKPFQPGPVKRPWKPPRCTQIELGKTLENVDFGEDGGSRFFSHS